MIKPWMQLIAVGFVGLAVGRLLPRGRAEGLTERQEATGTELRSATKVSVRDAGDRVGRIEKMRREAAAAKPGQIPGLVSRVIQIADPFERRAALMEVLRFADASNGGEIIEGFAKVTRETGRNNTEEWKAALVEVGRRGGTAMLETWKAKGKDGGDEEMWSGLYGMALDDPQGAMAWLDSPANGDLAGKQRLMAAVVAGATLANADEGIRLMAGLPQETRQNSLGHFTWNLIQNEGLDRAVDWMLDVRKTSAETEPEYAGAVENEIYEKIFGAARWTDGAGEMAGFLTRINAAEPITPQRMVETVSRMPGTSGLDVIDQLVRTPAMANNEAVNLALSIAARQAARNSPTDVRQWLEQHPVSPIAAEVRELMGGE